jgi:DNA-binding NtrC family response regulator
MKDLLLVDDEKLILSSLSEALRLHNANFNIITAGNGEEAMRILESSHIDLLITDLNMPVKNGYELIADMFKNHSDIPVIVMTASNCDSGCKMLQALNVKNFINKPFKFEKLVEIIHESLDHESKNKQKNFITDQ